MNFPTFQRKGSPHLPKALGQRRHRLFPAGALDICSAKSSVLNPPLGIRTESSNQGSGETNPSGWIVAARIPGMASQDSFQRSPGSPKGTVLADHLNGILTACRRESTGRTNQGTDANLIEANQLDQDGREKASNHALGGGDCPLQVRLQVFGGFQPYR